MGQLPQDLKPGNLVEVTYDWNGLPTKGLFMVSMVSFRGKYDANVPPCDWEVEVADFTLCDVCPPERDSFHSLGEVVELFDYADKASNVRARWLKEESDGD